MKKVLTIFCIFSISFSIKAQQFDFDWAKGFGGKHDDRGNSIAIDCFQNVLFSGTFLDTVDFDPGEGIYQLISSGSQSDFISKLDSAGKFIWAMTIPGTSRTAVSSDNIGNVYITGSFNGAVDFDPGAGEFFLNSMGYSDIFILKLDASGNFIWVKQVGGLQGYAACRDVQIEDRYIYMTGYFSDIIDFDPGIDILNISSNGGSDIFVSKLDTAGNLVWAKGMGGNSGAGDLGNSLAIDATCNIWVTGEFRSIVDFDPGSETFNLTSLSGGDIFILKLSPSGNFKWAGSIGGTNGGDDRGSSVAVDDKGNVYTTGEFQGTVDCDPGSDVRNLVTAGGYDIFISKLDSLGNYIWGKRIGSSLSYNSDYANGLTLDKYSNVYLTGYFADIVDFDPGDGEFSLIGSYADIFIEKLDEDGNFLGAVKMGGNGSDMGNDIKIDFSGNIYTIGNFGLYASTADFDPGTTTSLLVSSANSFDIFISKLKCRQIITKSVYFKEGSLKIYPNPAHSYVNVSFEKPLHNAKLLIYNLNGQILLNQNIIQNTINIDLSDFNNGVYMLKLVNSIDAEVIKLIKY